jgi:hypothetical protein
MVIAALWIILPCVTVFGAALMGIDMVRVPKDMDETRQGGAFWFENRRGQRTPSQTRAEQAQADSVDGPRRRRQGR